jgi:hypothetical protein
MHSLDVIMRWDRFVTAAFLGVALTTLACSAEPQPAPELVAVD